MECFPNEEGAINIPNSNRWIKKIDYVFEHLQVKEGERLYSKEDMEKAYEEGRLYGEWAENNYHIGDINKKNPYKTFNEYLHSIKNNQL